MAKNNELLQYLTGWRLMNNYSQRELATKLGLSLSMVGHCEKGRFEQPMLYVRKISTLMKPDEKKRLKEILMRQFEKELDFL